MKMNESQIKEFKDLCAPIIDWLKKNTHPHATVIMDNDHAELLEGLVGVKADAPKPEEPKPTWTPKVGDLIQGLKTSEVYEIDKINGGAFFVRGDCLTLIGKAECRPIAELEGLKVGDNVYAFAGESTLAWKIVSAPIENGCGGDYFKIELEEYTGKILVAFDGSPLFFGNGKQMFWRTKERAERFGK